MASSEKISGRSRDTASAICNRIKGDSLCQTQRNFENWLHLWPPNQQNSAENKLILISDNVLMIHVRRIGLPAKQDKKGPTLAIKRGPGSRPHGLEGSIEQFFCKVLTTPIPSLASNKRSHSLGVKTFRRRSERKHESNDVLTVLTTKTKWRSFCA